MGQKRKNKKKDRIKKKRKALKNALKSLEKEYSILERKYQKLKKAHKDLKKSSAHSIKTGEKPTKNSSRKPVARLSSQKELTNSGNTKNPRKKAAVRRQKPPGRTIPSSSEATRLQLIKKNSIRINFDRIGKGNARKKDRLTLIKGIGPSLQNRLYAAGIYHFEQISRFISEDEEVITEVLAYYKGRIKKEEWAKQAQALLSSKS